VVNVRAAGHRRRCVRHHANRASFAPGRLIVAGLCDEGIGLAGAPHKLSHKPMLTVVITFTLRRGSQSSYSVNSATGRGDKRGPLPHLLPVITAPNR